MLFTIIAIVVHAGDNICCIAIFYRGRNDNLFDARIEIGGELRLSLEDTCAIDDNIDPLQILSVFMPTAAIQMKNTQS